MTDDTKLTPAITRITPAMIEANIIGEHYFSAFDGAIGSPVHSDAGKGTKEGMHLLTFCVLTLRNGFMFTGESACADPSFYNAEIGRKVARENAINKCWPVMGYALRSRLYGTDGLEPV